MPGSLVGESSRDPGRMTSGPRHASPRPQQAASLFANPEDNGTQQVSGDLPVEPTYLTGEGRRLLDERVQVLAAAVAELQRALDDPESRADTVEEYQRSAQELERLRSLLDRAAAIEEVPDDPAVVELGDTVTIRLDAGTEEIYIIVDASEAPVEDQRISVQSPLGQALLGNHVGDSVDVQIPAGSYRCTILSASRT